MISAAEGSQAAARIQALHTYTKDAWEALLTMPRDVHPQERRRRRKAFEERVELFDLDWNGMG